jgi:hypothetical protein
MNWQKIDKQQSHDILNHIATVSDPHLFSPRSSETSYMTLPFYKDYFVYRVTNYATLPSFSLDFLSNGESYHLLDGSPAPINHVNKSGALHLSGTNVIAYADFCLGNIRGEDGDIYMIRDIETLPFIDSLGTDQQLDLKRKHETPSAKWSADDNGYELTADLFYGGTLIKSSIVIEVNGLLQIHPREMIMSSKIEFHGGTA